MYVSVNVYLLSFVVCTQLIGDVFTYSQENMVRYIELFPPFEGSREQKLLVKLIEAFNNSDTDAYEEAVKEYDSVSRLDDWLVKHLLIAKKRINMPGEDIN